jgi:hypothetical protein
MNNELERMRKGFGLALNLVQHPSTYPECQESHVKLREQLLSELRFKPRTSYTSSSSDHLNLMSGVSDVTS